MSQIQLTHSQHRAFVELPTKSLDELQKMYEKEKQKEKEYQSIPSEKLDRDYGLSVDIQTNYEVLHDLRMEIMRQEENLGSKTISELEEIRNGARRRARQMENYEWDVVEQSDADNQKGFWEHISYLESLEAAANFEMDRRNILGISQNHQPMENPE